MFIFVLIQSLSCVQPFAIPWTAARQASLSFTITRSLLKVIFIELVMPSNHFILCHPLLLLLLIFPSIRIFSNELAIRWPKYWSFSFSISPSNEYSGLISFRMDWFDLLAVQGTLNSLLYYRSSKASIFGAQPSLWSNSHPYVTTGKTITLTIWTFICKVMSLTFNMLSSFVIAFLPRSKHLLISWLQSLSTVILESKNIKSVIVSTFAPSICHEVIWLSRPTTGHMPQENYYLKRQCMTYPSVYCRSLFLNVIPINKSFLSQSLFLITI